MKTFVLISCFVVAALARPEAGYSYNGPQQVPAATYASPAATSYNPPASGSNYHSNNGYNSASQNVQSSYSVSGAPSGQNVRFAQSQSGGATLLSFGGSSSGAGSSYSGNGGYNIAPPVASSSNSQSSYSTNGGYNIAPPAPVFQGASSNQNSQYSNNGGYNIGAPSNDHFVGASTNNFAGNLKNTKL